MIRIFFLLLLGIIIAFLANFTVHEGSSFVANRFFTFPFSPVANASVTDATLSILSNPSTTGNTASAQIVLETSSTAVRSVQLELSYNPYYLRNMRVTPGDFFNAPVIPLNEVDVANGRISYVIIGGDTKPSKKTGTVAILSFTTGYIASGSSQEAKISLLPKSNVYTGTHEPLLNKIQDGIVVIK